MKEQLQALWNAESYESMDEELERWCEIADESEMHYLKTFAKSLRAHRKGICNYAKHKLTSARIEAGNISIGMIRKRARGLEILNISNLKSDKHHCLTTNLCSIRWHKCTQQSVEEPVNDIEWHQEAN